MLRCSIIWFASVRDKSPPQCIAVLQHRWLVSTADKRSSPQMARRFSDASFVTIKDVLSLTTDGLHLPKFASTPDGSPPPCLPLPIPTPSTLPPSPTLTRGAWSPPTPRMLVSFTNAMHGTNFIVITFVKMLKVYPKPKPK